LILYIYNTWLCSPKLFPVTLVPLYLQLSNSNVHVAILLVSPVKAASLPAGWKIIRPAHPQSLFSSAAFS
jgi:hypothetical protein